MAETTDPTTPSETTETLRSEIAQMTPERLMQRLESLYSFQCKAGSLVFCLEWETLKRKVAALTSLQEERAEAMRVLVPNMPESGLVDACLQVKQAAISEADNAEKAEARYKEAFKAGWWAMRSDFGDRAWVFEAMSGSASASSDINDAFNAWQATADPAPDAHQQEEKKNGHKS